MGRLLVANTSTFAVALETVMGIASPAINAGKRRIYLHDITIAPRAADFAADCQIYICKGFTGEELIVGGDLAAAGSWVAGAGWTIGSGVATKVVAATTALSQVILTSPVVGDRYKMTYDIVKTANGVTPGFAGDTGVADQDSGTYSDIFIAGDTTATLLFTADGTAQTVLDNVGMVKYGSSVNYYLHDTIRSGVGTAYKRTFHNKQPYSTEGWTFLATGAGAATILDMVVTYEIV